MTVEAQLKCDCGERDLVVTSPDATVGEQVEVKMYCSGCGSTERTVTVVYDPEEYDLKDPYGPADFTLRATCRDCGDEMYGPVDKCHACGGDELDRWLEGDTDA